MKDINEKELKILKNQLDREPENVNKIEVYCDKNRPMVLSTLPFRKGKQVLPTLYWLSCPFLVKKISKLEDQGFIKKLTKKVQLDPCFKKKLKKAHKIYAAKRFSLLSCRQIKEIKKISDDILDVIKNSGVGGIREKEGVKCLHTHLADYLVNLQNPVGKIVDNTLAELRYNNKWEVEDCEDCCN